MKIVNLDPPTNLNLCESAVVPENMVINYTYTDLERQMMTLDLGPGKISITLKGYLKLDSRQTFPYTTLPKLAGLLV